MKFRYYSSLFKLVPLPWLLCMSRVTSVELEILL